MEATPEIAKQSGRRKSKPNDLKKKPQRGMGVEKLERIRIGDEIRNKTTTPDQNHTSNFNLTNHHFVTPTFPDPSLQLHLAKLGSYGASQTGFNQALVLQRLGTGIYQVDPYGFIGSTSASNVMDTNSCKVPTLKCYSQHCAICFKKKRINGGNMVGNAERRMCAETNQSNSYNLSGFDVRNLKTVNNDLNIPNRQETEIVAVHRKGNKVGGNNNVVMEYEFFPGMKMEEKEMMMKIGSESSSSVLYGDQAAAGYYNNKQQRLTKTSFATAANSCIDLDLKLSY